MSNRPNVLESLVIRAICNAGGDVPAMSQVAWLAEQAARCASTTPRRRAYQLGKAWVKSNGKPAY